MKRFDVFINCPFDEEYRPIFEAMLFTIVSCGYQPRCALEENDAASLRLSKIVKIVDDCALSIHDLSRIQLSSSGLPRFNMPFELGLMMGAKHFGGKRRETKTALVMIDEQYSMPKYISDLAGSDPSHHKGEINKSIEIVRRYLYKRPSGGPSPGARAILEQYEIFKIDLPGMAKTARIEQAEIDAFVEYPTFLYFMTFYLKNNPVL